MAEKLQFASRPIAGLAILLVFLSPFTRLLAGRYHQRAGVEVPVAATPVDAPSDRLGSPARRQFVGRRRHADKGWSGLTGLGWRVVRRIAVVGWTVDACARGRIRRPRDLEVAARQPFDVDLEGPWRVDDRDVRTLDVGRERDIRVLSRRTAGPLACASRHRSNIDGELELSGRVMGR